MQATAVQQTKHLSNKIAQKTKSNKQEVLEVHQKGSIVNLMVIFKTKMSKVLKMEKEEVRLRKLNKEEKEE